MRDWPAAVMSPDGAYRYFLSRRWSGGSKSVAFIGLNPSTADATLDDPTIRRCVAFAKTWGGHSLLMVNLFALRATKPAVLMSVRDPIGPDNDAWIDRATTEADIVVAAWGNLGALMDRGKLVQRRFSGQLLALDVTKAGMPKHPLYVAAAQALAPFKG
jgi:hypothetical protein